MKPIFSTLILAALVSGLAGCESDLPPEPNRDNPLQRGISGQGRLIQQDRTNDPIINENATDVRVDRVNQTPY